jgi:hypothetical protein
VYSKKITFLFVFVVKKIHPGKTVLEAPVQGLEVRILFSDVYITSLLAF